MPTTATYSEIREMYPAASQARTLSAAARGWQIDKAADPVDGAASDISVDLAEDVAAIDPGLQGAVERARGSADGAGAVDASGSIPTPRSCR